LDRGFRVPGASRGVRRRRGHSHFVALNSSAR
jgi:hypothetical protein